MYFTTIKIKNQQTRGRTRSSHHRNASACWSGLAGRRDPAVPGVREVALRLKSPCWCPTGHPGSMPFLTAGDAQGKSQLQESVSRRPGQAPLPLSEAGPAQGPDVLCSGHWKASPGIHHFPHHGATSGKEWGGEVVSTLDR